MGMAFTPQFLDDIRARVPLADVVGKRLATTETDVIKVAFQSTDGHDGVELLEIQPEADN